VTAATFLKTGRIASFRIDNTSGTTPTVVVASGWSKPTATFNLLSQHPQRTPAEWSEREYRQAYMQAAIEQGVSWQIRVNREERGWTQEELAQRMGTKQSAVSRLEDPEDPGVTLRTLIKAANAFDCALLVKFVPYSTLAQESEDLSPERLYAASFGDEAKGPIWVVPKVVFGKPHLREADHHE
jgi:transcriptional regulator with XRE-family HTH domain